MQIVVIGEAGAVDGFRLAGATVVRADDAVAVRHAWNTLPPDTAVVVLSASAAAVLGDDAASDDSDVLTIAMPR